MICCREMEEVGGGILSRGQITRKRTGDGQHKHAKELMEIVPDAKEMLCTTLKRG